MKSLIAFIVLLSVEFNDGSTRYLPCENDNKAILRENLLLEPNVTAIPTDLTYYYYSQKNQEKGVPIKSTNIGILSSTYFDPSKVIIFIIHGWRSGHDNDVNTHIIKSILKGQDCNIFVVDWSPAAGKDYVSAFDSVERIGLFVADFVMSLVVTYKIRLETVKFVGHSLGAHVSGNAGAALQGRVEMIVGLDPAGPLFCPRYTGNRLDPKDAMFVQVIHTNDGRLALQTPMGHADYYPNGGKIQPGCGFDLTGSCAHARAYSYYAESLTSEKFIATQCNSFKNFVIGRCKKNAVSRMGMFNVDTSARGTYFLVTNKAFPYAKG